MKQIVSVLAAFVGGVALATDYTWNGGVSGSWGGAANWTPQGTPGAGDVAYFPSATEITGDFSVGDGTLVITNGAGTLSFNCSISGAGHLDLRGCGEKRFYKDSTFSGGLEAHGTGYRPDGTFITFNGLVAGDSGAVRVYSGGALGTGTAAIGEKRVADSGGIISTTGARVYFEGDLTVTTPLLIGFPRDGLNNLTMNSSLITFSANVTATDRLYMELLKADGHCHFTENKFYVPGYMETMNRGHYHFYGATMGSLYGNISTTIHLHDWVKVTYGFIMYRGKTVCEAADVIDWANASGSIQFTAGNVSTLDLNGYDQTITKVRPAAANVTFHSDSRITSPVESPAKLRFSGLATGTSTFGISSALQGSAGIVWAPTSSDATLTLSGNTASTTTGDLVVSNGTLRLVGYSLGSLSSVYVCNGATLDIDDASLDALGANRLFVEESASVVLGSSQGGTANIRRVTLVDTALQTKTDLAPGATYTAAAAPQFSGPGSISIPMPTVTTWEAPVSGLWTDAQKWSYGTPTASIAAEITADGSDYTVSVGDAKVPGLAVHNYGEGSARLSAEGTLDLSDATVAFGAGSELVVAKDATVAFTGTATAAAGASTVTIGEGAAWTVTGKVDVVKTKFQLAKGASLEFAGQGSLNRKTASDSAKTWAIWSQSGASLLFKDDAVYEIMYTWDAVAGSGRTVFRDRAKLKSSIVYNTAARMYFFPDDVATPCEVYFEDDSSCNLTYASMTEMRTSEGRTHVEFNSSGTHTLGYWQLGGYNPGIAEAVITKGQVRADGSSGFIMSGQPGMYKERSYNTSCATSLLQVVEGSLWVSGASAAGSECLYGFVVGAGAPEAGAPLARARIELSGGAITNANEKSMLWLGVGRSVGEIVQTGGEFVSLVTDSRCPNVIGLQNGQALYALSNGVARIKNPIYVGGCTTNTLCRSFLRDRSGLADSVGQITVAAADTAKPCQFTAEDDVILGGLGRGILETGPGGVLTAANLVLSNNVSSLVRCRVDDRGAGLVNISGKLVVTGGATLEVDASALTQPLGRAVDLIRFDSMEGAFVPENIRLVGGPSGTAVVILPDRICLKSPKGLVLIFR